MLSHFYSIFATSLLRLGSVRYGIIATAKTVRAMACERCAGGVPSLPVLDRARITNIGWLPRLKGDIAVSHRP